MVKTILGLSCKFFPYNTTAGACYNQHLYQYHLYHNYHDHPCHQDHLNDILRQSKDRCSNLAATADRVFRILQVLLNKGNVP